MSDGELLEEAKRRIVNGDQVTRSVETVEEREDEQCGDGESQVDAGGDDLIVEGHVVCNGVDVEVSQTMDDTAVAMDVERERSSKRLNVESSACWLSVESGMDVAAIL